MLGLRRQSVEVNVINLVLGQLEVGLGSEAVLEQKLGGVDGDHFLLS